METSNIYESGDSSYLQLIDSGNGSLTLRPTDGSQLSYTLRNGQYLCDQIKDRNGNFISASYYTDGRLSAVTDTLARVITFNYDAYQNLTSITQTWTSGGQQQTRIWATFGWGNTAINPSFTDLTVVGPQNGTVIPVLTQVGYPDGTRYTFEYNSYGQVTVVMHYAADNHQLSYTAYTFGASASDCPRVTDSRVWAENWNNNLEAVTQYSTASDRSWGQMTAPDNKTLYKELYATSGWQRGLTAGTEFWSKEEQSGVSTWVKKKWTTTAYTQDDTSLPYPKNPRLTETNVYDSNANRKRTTIDYGAYAPWGLPYKVTEYDADGTTEIRHTYTDYNLNVDYVNRRIIGLPSQTLTSDIQTWQTKTVYTYDEGGDQLQATSVNATQHDPSYGTGFRAGRGNLTSVSRYDVTPAYVNDESRKLRTQIGYDTNGSVIFTRDPLGHQTSLSYTDSFSDSANRNTFAYPTTATDADSYSSTTQYNYHLGDVTRTQMPAPAGQSQGAIQTFEYDSAGRISRVNNVNNGAYRRWVYDPYGYVSVFDTIQSGSAEAYSVVVYDGMGRVRATGGDNPNSAGGYRGQFVFYDVMGRAMQTSNPAEINGGWAPAGDDASGWTWTLQAYDWKGRQTLTTNPDGTTKEATYGGCGCAGGEVVTLRDEVGRRQRITSDVLGRALKTEVLNWDGSVYSTVINTYNMRDQITNANYYQGTGASSAYQESIMTYDGYGRLQTSKAPEQTSSTSYTYYEDDTTKTVTDARGATQTLSYNNRHQVTGVTYVVPSGVAFTAPISFQYDAAGNRTQMTDGLGSVSYQYDQLSRLTSESRQFTGLLSTYTLSYGYNLAGKLTGVTDPTGAQISYAYDHTGRLSGVTSSGFGSVSNYASNMQYRAWGGLKRLTFGDNNQHSVSLSYTARMQLRRYQVDYVPYLTVTNGAEYQYDPDGRLIYSHELAEPDQDRAFTYDHAGRLTQALSGAEARGEAGADSNYIPFKQNYSYDVWNNLTSRTGQYWGHSTTALTASYVNNRNQNPQWQYDAAGNTVQQGTPQGTRQYSYDAVGRQVLVTEPPRRSGEVTLTITEGYDGDGRRVKRTQNGVASYEVRSSVLEGRVITDFNAQGQKENTYVYANGTVLARQSGSDDVTWMHAAPDGSGRWQSLGGGAVGSGRTVSLDPMGDDVGVENPYLSGLGGDLGGYPRYGDPTDLVAGCAVDDSPLPCEVVGKGVSHEHASFLYYMINKRIGMRMEEQRTDTIYDDSSILKSVNLGLPVPGGASVTIAPGPDVLSVSTVGYSMSWIDLRPITQIVPQNFAQNERLKAAKAELEKRLRERPACTQLIGKNKDPEKALNNALKALRKTNFIFQSFGGPISQDGVNITYNVHDAITKGNITKINSDGRFMAVNGTLPVMGRPGFVAIDVNLYGLGDVESAAFILLHELGHRTNALEDDSEKAHDPQGAEDRNNDKVYKACFKD